MNKRTIYIPKATFPLSTKGIVSDLFELKHDVIIFTLEELKELLEEYTNKIVNEVGLVETTSEELNSKDYQPFITDENDKLWTINKEHIFSQLPEFLKKKDYE
jgi:hypothetical protein